MAAFFLPLPRNSKDSGNSALEEEEARQPDVTCPAERERERERVWMLLLQVCKAAPFLRVHPMFELAARSNWLAASHP